MQAYELRSDRPGLDAVTLVDRPDPQPQAGQVLVKMHAAALNYRDLLVAKGSYGSQAIQPIVPLSDGAGEVVAIGSGVTRVQVGDRVAGAFMQTFLAGELTPEKSKSALGGAIAIVLADTLARTVAAPTELPVGAMTAMAGAPFFIYLLRRGMR